MASTDHPDSIVRDVVALLGNAQQRGVRTVLVLDSGEKPYGKNNREALIALWPNGVQLPETLTWQVPSCDAHLKLHAKVLVADRQDALVTSANLTMHALDMNMEMGVRVRGMSAGRIAHHFDLLVQAGTLAPFE